MHRPFQRWKFTVSINTSVRHLRRVTPPHRIHAGIAQPSLFSSIVLIDPTVLPPPGDGLHMYPGSYNIIVDVMQRRERWRSSYVIIMAV